MDQCTQRDTRMHLSGSMTLEAAVVVPILACLFTFVLFFFRVMQVQLCVQDALEDTDDAVCLCSRKGQSGREVCGTCKKYVYCKGA